MTTPQSTPPSTPNGSGGHLEHGPHKVPSIMTPMMKLKRLSPSSAKVISHTGSIKAKAFYSPPVKILPDRTAGSVARRRLSRMSMSSEDEEEPDRFVEKKPKYPFCRQKALVKLHFKHKTIFLIMVLRNLKHDGRLF